MIKNPTSKYFLIDLGLILLVLWTRILSASQYLHKWDSVQFALGLTNFDITRHQPHPPGYPGYIAAGKLALMFTHDPNGALVIVNVASAMIIAIGLHRIGLKLIGERGGLTAGLLAVTNPLLWYFSSIALAYISGVAVSVLAVWALISDNRKIRILSPVLAGLASVFWLPAGILVMPVILWAFINRPADPAVEPAPDSNPESKSANPILLILISAVLFAIPVILGYLYPILATGGLIPFIAEIQSESGKHVLRFEEWVHNPLTEFLATTGSIAAFAEQGLGIGKYLLLGLLIPITGEIGCMPKKVAGLVPLGIVGFIAMHWGQDIVTRTAGILVFFFAVLFLLPRPSDPSAAFRQRLVMWWLIPGILLFTLVYVNYVGIFTFFLPPLIFLEAWCIDRASAFMLLQTIRDRPVVKPAAEKIPADKAPASRKPDAMVGHFVAWILIVFVILSDVGGFIGGKTQESWDGIIERDKYISAIIDIVDNAPFPQDQLLVIGGTDDYRHWTFYLPEAQITWAKYLLYGPIHEGVGIWSSRDRVQDKIYPEISPSELDPATLEASIPISPARAIILFPDEMERFRVSGVVMGLGAELSEDGEPLCYLIEPGERASLVFSEGIWWLE